MPSDKDPVTASRRFLLFCLSILIGVVLLWLAVRLLAQFWGWLALLAAIAVTVYVVVRVLRARRDRW